MDVEVTMDAARHRRIRWPYRLAEGAGLLALIYGLVSSAWWIALAGAAVIVIAYASYPRKHRRNGSSGDAGPYYVGSDGRRDGDDRDDNGDSDTDSGGGDGGGGD
jgi:hypothetical protein